MTERHNANGHRRREVRARVLAEEHTCGLCDKPVDKSLGMVKNQHSQRCTDRLCTGCVPHRMRAEVDEDIPRSRGGSPYDRSNTHLLHRACNQWKKTQTLEEARARWARETTQHKVKASNIW